jgi:hypothetical protein
MAKKPDHAARLKAAEAAHTATLNDIARVGLARADALHKDDDAAAADLDAKLEGLHRLAKVHKDKIAIIQSEAESELRAASAKERSALIARVQDLFLQREGVGAELTRAIKHTNDLFLEMIELGRQIDAGWPWPGSDRHALLLPREHGSEIVANELHRLTYHVRLGGGQAEHVNAGIRFPSPRPPRLDLVDRPAAIPPLVEVLASASKYGSEIMLGMRSSVMPKPVSKPEPNKGLSLLLERQNELANITNPTTAQEVEYGEVIKQIAMLQTETPANVQ